MSDLERLKELTARLKHLPGKHDQSEHGRGRRGGGGKRSGGGAASAPASNSDNLKRNNAEISATLARGGRMGSDGVFRPLTAGQISEYQRAIAQNNRKIRDAQRAAERDMVDVDSTTAATRRSEVRRNSANALNSRLSNLERQSAEINATLARGGRMGSDGVFRPLTAGQISEYRRDARNINRNIRNVQNQIRAIQDISE